jgi:outer membrane protein OmpA-like peptidoglycan-associated protein
MKQYLRKGWLLAFLLFLVVGSDVLAQERPDKTFFIRPRVGLSHYLGDSEKSPFNFDGDLFDNGFPYSVGLEVGYHFNPRYSVGLAFQNGRFSNITEFVNTTNVDDHPSTRSSLQLISRMLLSDGKVAPYLQFGLNAGFGETTVFSRNCQANINCRTDKSNLTLGPLFGAGLDFWINRNSSFFVEILDSYQFPDESPDGRDNNGFGPGDVLGAISAGLKFNLGGATAPEVLSLTCPATEVLSINEASFSAAVNENATQPVTYAWNFGDGGTASGQSTTHRFARGGTYNVSVTATNKAGSDTESCSVTVRECQAAQIASMSANNTSPDTRTNVTFNANVTGTQPTYRWDFGDGTTSTQASPSKTFAREGTYTVRLDVTNCGGSTSRTMTITVRPYESDVCNVAEMNSVFFEPNSSVLTPEGRQALQENLQILQECPNLRARIEGFAAPGERNPDQLSLDRARAVEKFYTDNGIAASRLEVVGRGRIGGTTKKEGAAQLRRADTIPLR